MPNNISDKEESSFENQDLADEGIFSGVEKEEEEPFYKTTQPFEPEKISINSKWLSLDNVLRRLKNNTIILAPDFQREFVWDKKRKSQLIESMVLRIPLPMFYVAERLDGVWEVVDGLQRLTTIRDFVLGKNNDGKGDKLSGLEFLGENLDGKNFFSLENDPKAARLVNNIMEAQLSFTIINPDTPDKVKRNIFSRLNTGGMRLSDQEIRHALYQGKATALLKELASSHEYLDATDYSVKDNRMAGRELILRFLAFNILGRENLKTSMDDFLSNTMRFINGEHLKVSPVNPDVDLSVRNFKTGINRSLKIFNDHAFRKSTNGDRKTPINKALFEVWINKLSELSDDDFQCILNRKTYFLEDYKALLNDDDFTNAISRHGSSPTGSSARYNQVSKLINKYLD